MATRSVLRSGMRKTIEPRVFSVLEILIEQAGEVVPSEEIINKVWHRDYLGNPPLAQAIGKLRMILGDDAQNPKYIETVTKVGYRLKSSVMQDPKTNENKKVVLLLGVGVIAIASLLLIPIYKNFYARSMQVTEKPVRAVSIAVLPIENSMDSNESQLLAEGMAEAIRSILRRQSELVVIGLTSTKLYDDSKELQESFQLNQLATYTVAGSIIQTDLTSHVHLSLIDNSNSSSLWTDKFVFEKDNPLDSYRSLSIRASQSILQALEIDTALEISEASSRVTNPDAHTHYLLGRRFHSGSTKESLEKAVQSYEKAISYDPEYALAWIGLTRTMNSQMSRGYFEIDEYFGPAWRASERALSLDSANVEAWANACWLLTQQKLNRERAKPYCDRVFQIGPKSSEAYRIATEMALFEGRLDGAIEYSQKRLEVDPLHSAVHGFHGLLLFYDRQYKRAKDSLDRALSLNPKTAMVNGLYAQILLHEGKYAPALKRLEQEHILPYREQTRILVAMTSESSEVVYELLTRFLNEYSSRHPFLIAELYGHMDDRENTIYWLTESKNRADSGLMLLLETPYLKVLSEEELATFSRTSSRAAGKSKR